MTEVSAAPDVGAADTVAVALRGEAPPAEPWLSALVDAGEARSSAGHLAHVHHEGRRWILVGAGPAEEWGPERAREAAAQAYGRARELGARRLAWMGDEPGALVEGTLLAARRFDRYKKAEGPALEVLTLVGAEDQVVRRATIGARAQNRARDLQDTPPNDSTPSALAERAQRLSGVRAEILDPEAEGLGAFHAVARGSDEPGKLIALSYDGGGDGPLTGWIGKAVTFDSGGYSLKQPAKMHEMKWDMSGGAAVLEAVSAVAELGLPVRLLAVIGAAENLVSGRAVKPGDIVAAKDGTTIEVNNTDAEGRLVLADCMLWARERGVERMVDIATLTGGIVTALGTAYAGLMGNDEEWMAQVRAAGDATGEQSWPLPIHRIYRDAMKGMYADLVNSAPEKGKAHALTAAAFLERFAGDVPWAHLDIAGVADNNGRAYTRKGGSGWGVRTLIELAASMASSGLRPLP